MPKTTQEQRKELLEKEIIFPSDFKTAIFDKEKKPHFIIPISDYIEVGNHIYLSTRNTCQTNELIKETFIEPATLFNEIDQLEIVYPELEEYKEDLLKLNQSILNLSPSEILKSISHKNIPLYMNYEGFKSKHFVGINKNSDLCIINKFLEGTNIDINTLPKNRTNYENEKDNIILPVLIDKESIKNVVKNFISILKNKNKPIESAKNKITEMFNEEFANKEKGQISILEKNNIDNVKSSIQIIIAKFFKSYDLPVKLADIWENTHDDNNGIKKNLTEYEKEINLDKISNCIREEICNYCDLNKISVESLPDKIYEFFEENKDSIIDTLKNDLTSVESNNILDNNKKNVIEYLAQKWDDSFKGLKQIIESEDYDDCKTTKQIIDKTFEIANKFLMSDILFKISNINYNEYLKDDNGYFILKDNESNSDYYLATNFLQILFGIVMQLNLDKSEAVREILFKNMMNLTEQIISNYFESMNNDLYIDIIQKIYENSEININDMDFEKIKKMLSIEFSIFEEVDHATQSEKLYLLNQERKFSDGFFLKNSGKFYVPLEKILQILTLKEDDPEIDSKFPIEGLCLDKEKYKLPQIRKTVGDILNKKNINSVITIFKIPTLDFNTKLDILELIILDEEFSDIIKNMETIYDCYLVLQDVADETTLEVLKSKILKLKDHLFNNTDKIITNIRDLNIFSKIFPDIIQENNLQIYNFLCNEICFNRILGSIRNFKGFEFFYSILTFYNIYEANKQKIYSWLFNDDNFKILIKNSKELIYILRLVNSQDKQNIHNWLFNDDNFKNIEIFFDDLASIFNIANDENKQKIYSWMFNEHDFKVFIRNSKDLINILSVANDMDKQNIHNWLFNDNNFKNIEIFFDDLASIFKIVNNENKQKIYSWIFNDHHFKNIIGNYIDLIHILSIANEDDKRKILDWLFSDDNFNNIIGDFEGLTNIFNMVNEKGKQKILDWLFNNDNFKNFIRNSADLIRVFRIANDEGKPKIYSWLFNNDNFKNFIGNSADLIRVFRMANDEGKPKIYSWLFNDDNFKNLIIFDYDLINVLNIVNDQGKQKIYSWLFNDDNFKSFIETSEDLKCILNIVSEEDKPKIHYWMFNDDTYKVFIKAPWDLESVLSIANDEDKKKIHDWMFNDDNFKVLIEEVYIRFFGLHNDKIKQELYSWINEFLHLKNDKDKQELYSWLCNNEILNTFVTSSFNLKCFFETLKEVPANDENMQKVYTWINTDTLKKILENYSDRKELSNEINCMINDINEISNMAQEIKQNLLDTLSNMLNKPVTRLEKDSPRKVENSSPRESENSSPRELETDSKKNKDLIEK